MVECLPSMHEALALIVNTHMGETGDEDGREGEEEEEERDRRATLKFQHGPTSPLAPDPIIIFLTLSMTSM